MVEFLKIMAKYGLRLQRGTGDQGGKTQYTHAVSISSYHKSICIGNGMTVASTQSSKEKDSGFIYTTGNSSVKWLVAVQGPNEGLL
jgi:hypothetical protein